ncbi:hypothetical protein [Crocinitomix algicola]|uniref:hypothetical protein n=1 Tax=Crocinitomix algicola TaxID=1740263 RepID=UPI000871BF79|nr:hypothetical protein [Crocinitomix algicola]
MKINSTILILLFAFNARGQNKVFFDQLDRTERNEIVSRVPNRSKLSIVDFDKKNYASIIVHQINAYRKKRGRKIFEQDSVFNQVCNTSVKHLPRSFFKDKKKRKKLIRYVERSIKYLKGDYRVFNAIIFQVNLTNLKKHQNFHYLSKDQSTELKLFFGKRMKLEDLKNPKKKKPEPVKAITELDFTKAVITKIQSQNTIYNLLAKNFSHIGLYVKVDEYSLHRKKIPTAFAMVIIGGKQTQEYSVPKVEQKQDEDPTIILK